MNIKPSNTKEPKNKKQQEKRPPKKITATYLHNSGLYYLQRFTTSSSNFREVMRRKAFKSCQAHEDQDMETCRTLIDELIVTFEASGLLNDVVYARGMVASLRRQGKSSKAITMKLKSKGLPEPLIKDEINEYDLENNEHVENAELNAALIFARKKRLGPFDKNIEKDDKKSLARLARNGFSFETARTVLNISYEDAEELL